MLDLLRSKCDQIDQLITYEEFEEALGRPLQSNRAPLYRAIEKLEKENKRTLLAVDGKGYRVAHPNEAAGTVRRRIKRGERQIGRGKKLADCVDVALLTTVERDELYDVKRHVNALQHEMRLIRKKTAQQDRVLAQHSGRISDLEQRPTFSAEELRVLKSLASRATEEL